MATLTLQINAATKWDASPMLVCSNRNHVYGQPNGYGWNYGDGRGVPKEGYQPAVLNAMKALNTTWGGGKYAQYKGKVGYRFGHEPTDGTFRLGSMSATWTGFFFDECFGKSGSYPYDDPKYALMEGEAMNAEFTWVVNFGSNWLRTTENPNWSPTQHTIDLYNYHNHPTDTKRLGSWRQAPYAGGIKWYEIGNEMGMQTQYGHGYYLDSAKTKLDTSKPHFAASTAEYAQYAAKLAWAIHKADSQRPGGPLGAKALFCTGTGLHFDGDGGWKFGNDPTKLLKQLLDNAWTDADGNKVAAGTPGARLQIDGFITHNYPSYPLEGGDAKTMTLQNKLAMSAWAYPRLLAARQWLDNYAPGGSAAFEWVNTEHFTKWYKPKDQGYGGSFYGLDMLLFCMNNGYAWSNAFCMWHNMNNTDEVWFYRGNPATPTAWYSFLSVLAKNFGDHIVTATCPDSPAWTAKASASAGGYTWQVPHMHLAAAKSADGKKLYLIVMNKSFDSDHQLPLRQANVMGFTFNEAANIRMWKLSPKAGVTDYENSTWDAYNAPTEQVLVAGSQGYHTLKAERMTIALYELTTSASSPPPPPPAPVISGFNPTQGPVGTVVTITGDYFASDAEVRFGGANGAVAELLSASSTQLVVRVPPLAVTGKIRMTVSNQSVDSAGAFTLTASEPVITEVTPMAGKPGDRVVIRGANFNPADLLVMIGLLPADVQSATVTEIQAVVPEGGVDYPVIILTNGYTLQTAGVFEILAEAQPGPRPTIVAGLNYGRAFVDSTPVDGEIPYILAWQESDWGDVEGREPTVTDTAGGVWTVYPLETAMSPRKGRLVIYAKASDVLTKQKLESQMKGLLWGRHRLHVGSRHLEVYFGSSREVGNDARRAATLVGVEASFVAPDPRWKLNQPLNGILRPVNVGPQWGIFDDQLIPLVLPAYAFEVASFSFDNWGTAWTYGRGFVTNGPRNTTLYLRGVADVRTEVRLDAYGQAVITEGHQLFLRPGINPIRIEQADGRLFALPPGFKLDLGDTYMRFL